MPGTCRRKLVNFYSKPIYGGTSINQSLLFHLRPGLWQADVNRPRSVNILTTNSSLYLGITPNQVLGGLLQLFYRIYPVENSWVQLLSHIIEQQHSAMN
jgi:hypothetical protein